MKRKQIIGDIADVIAKHGRLQQIIEQLSKNADQLAKEAEEKQDINLLNQKVLVWQPRKSKMTLKHFRWYIEIAGREKEAL